MKKVSRVLRRMHHAGIRNSMGVVRSRLAKRIAHTRPGRILLPAVPVVTDETLRQAIKDGNVDAPAILDAVSERYFLEDIDGCVALAREHFPKEVDRTIAVADAVCRHEFEFLGRHASFDDTVDWHWLPERETSWPVLPAPDYRGSRGYYSEARAADAKYPWELGRHQYFVTLGKAYRYTGDERYAEEFVRQVTHWIEANPYGIGIHWVSTMEVGIRLISWVNALAFMKDSAAVRSQAAEPLLRSFYQHALHLDAHLTTDWLVRTNHIIGETAGLFLFGALFPQFRRARRFRNKALSIFTHEVLSQTFLDGVNKEQATGYHRFVVDFVLLVLRVADRNNITTPPALRARLEKLLEYELHLLGPDGRVPQIGDCDDGRGFIFSESVDFFDFRGWLAVGALWFDRDDFAAIGDANEEALWFLGPDGWRQTKERARPAPARASRLFPQGGQAILRAGDGPEGTYVHVRCGPFGLGGDGASAHSHADLLSPVIHWRGRPLTVDAGTYAYYCDTAERDRFRSTAMHNTLAPAGVNQAELVPLKDWMTVPTTRVTAWEAKPEATRLEAELEAPGRYRHRRCLVLASDPLRLTVEDELTLAPGLPPALLEWRFHLAPGLDGRVEGDAVTISDANGPIAVLRHKGYGTARVEDGEYSPRYGVREANRCIVLAVTADRARSTVVLTDADDER